MVYSDPLAVRANHCSNTCSFGGTLTAHVPRRLCTEEHTEEVSEAAYPHVRRHAVGGTTGQLRFLCFNLCEVCATCRKRASSSERLHAHRSSEGARNSSGNRR
eukprot:scaffold1738_cov246-Prasinococcus_capsulatus_cf.AAC.1